MIQRERQATGRVTEASLPPAADQPVPLPSASPPDPRPLAALRWDDVYHGASPAQRAALLDLANCQGVIYAQQLPTPNGGPPRDPRRVVLGQLLAGKNDDLEPLCLEPLEYEDTELDAVQREAVARALATPDLCLLQGHPGTGKTRVAAEIIARAAARGDRVLLLAPSAATIDHALERLVERETVYAIRCPGPNEVPESLPPLVQGLLFPERVRQLREQALEGARRQARSSEERHAGLLQAEKTWGHLEEIAGRHDQLAQQREALCARREQVADDVAHEVRRLEAETTAPATNHDPVLYRDLVALCSERTASFTRIEEARAVLGKQQAEREREQASLSAEVEQLRPLAEARRAGRWWTGAWWRSVFRGNLLAQVSEKEDHLRDVQKRLEELRQEAVRLMEATEEAERCFGAGRDQLAAEAVARRLAELDDQEAVLGQEENLIQKKRQAACRELGPEIPAPAAPTREAVRTAREAWQQQLRRAEEFRNFSRQWAACLDETADDWPRRVHQFASVVAATTTGLAGDPQFGDSASPPVLFDLLVLEGAHQVTESEFLNVARRARRWVLLGEPVVERRRTPPAALRGESGTPDSEAGPAGRATVPHSFFHRLWQSLHFDPRRLPHSWSHEKGRVCCRLRPLAPDQRRWLESEPVADSPDIELRIYAPPRTPPVLAEILFPAKTSIAQAKEYIFRELGQLPLQTVSDSLRWVEKPEQLALCLSDAPANGAVVVALEDGVRELVAVSSTEVNGWHTCRVEFDRKAGWHRQRAEEWVRQHAGLRDPGRTVRLDVAYRMHPELALVLSDWLFAGAFAPPPAVPALAALAGPAPVQFVPVPSPAADARSRPQRGSAAGRASQGRTSVATAPARAAKGGAGLELDAGEPRHRDRLPSELRGQITSRGYVNYLEAQAVVRALEKLVTEPALRSAAAHAGCGPSRPAIGVLALYPAQAELIRILMRQTPALVNSEVCVRVEVPATFREGECLVVLVSLTRSHTHRAVSFGEGPEQLARALTRARARLIVFGDPGTLIRRTQWEAALDHLDESASTREQEVVAGLVSYLQGQGPHSRHVKICEGSGP